MTFLSHVNYTGKTSMEVGIKVVAEQPRTRKTRHVMSCFFTMVAVDEKGNPTTVPQLEVETELEQKLFEAGKKRKELRAQYEKAHEGTLIRKKAA